MARFLSSLLLVVLVVSASAGRRRNRKGEALVAPEGACDLGCGEGSTCKPDKEAGCEKADFATNASCWACAAERVKPTRPDGACAEGCEEGDVCLVDITCDGFEANPECWACGEKPSGRNGRKRRKGRKSRN